MGPLKLNFNINQVFRIYLTVVCLQWMDEKF